MDYAVWPAVVLATTTIIPKFIEAYYSGNQTQYNADCAHELPAEEAIQQIPPDCMPFIGNKQFRRASLIDPTSTTAFDTAGFSTDSKVLYHTPSRAQFTAAHEGDGIDEDFQWAVAMTCGAVATGGYLVHTVVSRRRHPINQSAS